MTISMHSASVPIFVRMLGNMLTWLDKAEAHATAKKFDTSVLLATRLAPDMLDFKEQIQIACDAAKFGVARLAGVEAPKFEDTEATLDELRARIRKTIDYVQGFKAAQIDGSEARDVTLKIAGKPLTLQGQPYLLQFVLPNFFFHTTAAYAILRHNGVELGKRDFVGHVPGMNV